MDSRNKNNANDVTDISSRGIESKAIYSALVSKDNAIALTDFINDPELRIQNLLAIREELNTLNRRIIKQLSTKQLNRGQPILDLKSSKEDHLKALDIDGLNYVDYQYHKNELMAIYHKNIHEKIQEAKIESVWSKAFYVHTDRFGKKIDEPRTAMHYFMGVPDKNPSKFFGALEWVSYIGGGFAISPLKNTLKILTEVLPNYIATRLENRIDRLAREATAAIKSKQEPSAWNNIDGTLSSMGYGIFKGLWVLGRAITSPVTSAKAGWETGFAFGQWLGGDSVWAQRIFGTLFGAILGLPSLVIGAAATIATVVFVPGTLIWAIGKIPVVGVEAAAWLAAASQTLGSLKVVSEVAASQGLIARFVAPVFAASLEFGFSGFATLMKAGQGILKLIGFAQREPTIINPEDPKPQGLFDSSESLGGSYVLINEQGIPVQKDKSTLPAPKSGGFDSEDPTFQKFLTDPLHRRKGRDRTPPSTLGAPPPSMTEPKRRFGGSGWK